VAKLTAKERARRQSIANHRKLKRRLRAESRLLEWKVTKLPKGQFGLRCPRHQCGGKAVVNAKRWLSSRPDFETRSCTYCYVPSWIPEELLP
jgi:hypothetical protein